MRLSIRAAAKAAGVGTQTIAQAMDDWVRSGGCRGLRHVDDGAIETKSGEIRRQRWTTERWIEDWEDRLADLTIGSNVSKKKTKLVPDSRGVLPGSTKDILRQQGHYKR